MQTQYEYLLKPGRIGKMELKNRIIFNPCETVYATVDGQVTQKIIDYYVRRAQGGTALTVTHSTNACTKLDPTDPYMPALRVDDNAYIPMLAELAEAVHRAGAKIAMLVSAGAGAQSTGFPYDRGLEGVKEIENVGVSEKQSQVAKRKVRKLSIDEIEKIIEVYGLAARRVKTAGFDAFYIHAWGGYLISQFLSPYYNTRDDKYGKDFEGRLRFLLELIESCRKNMGPDFPLVVKLSIDEFIPGGRSVKDSIKIAKRLEEVGVDAIDAGAGMYESIHYIVPPVYLPKGCMLDLAAAVKKEVKIPVITGGRIYDPEMAEEVLREGKADFVAVVRGMLADPYWANKVRDGQAHEIRKCVTCNHCIGRVLTQLPIRCAVNPATGREGEFDEVPTKASESKRVVIVGAGPGGMEAARIAAERGHCVKLFERTGELGGGQLRLAATPPLREELLNFAEYQKNQFQKLDNIEIVLNRDATVDDILAENPDVVVLATGASPFLPKIEGINNINVVTARDVLAGKTEVKGKVVIAGGGLIGAETADELSEKGIDVTVVEMLDQIALDEELLTRLTLLARLERKGVKMITGLKVERITEQGVVAVDKDNKKTTIPADYVVVALGAIPYNPLEEELKARFKEYYVIGDAKEPRRIADAVREGFLVGYEV